MRLDTNVFVRRPLLLEGPVSYTGLVLDEQAKQAVLNSLDPELLSKFGEIICHHMTLNMGACKDPEMLGKQYSMKIVGVGYDDKVLAVKVDTECPSSNAIKHITIGVNRANGGKPFLSNKLTDWVPFDGPTIFGTIEECA